MTRPALVIGLGGTGQWVLTYLKKDLIESNNGQMPDNVRIMCFDTMPQATAEITATGISRKGEKEVKVGSIRLEKNKEFIHLGGDILELSRAISDDREKRKNDQQLDHMYWFQDRYWLDNLPLALFRLADGAGQLRQFGRMGLYKDLGDPLKSEVWRRLDAAIGQLDQMRQGQRLEILIVGSFAGGTGSGLFIDLALLARHRARSVPIMLRGYFVLPRAFDADADDDMLARSFAAWRELNRFMVVSQEFALPSMVYNSRDRSLQVQQIRHKLFDLCYLVDGVRGGARVAAEAESGVHPTVADAISAIVDDKAGDAYTKWAENILKEYAVNPGIPLYSTIGTHSYKVPVYYAQQEFSRRFTVNWLDKLVKPIRDDAQNPDRVTRVDTSCPGDPGKPGRQEALSMLVSPHEYAGTSEVPTLLYQQIATLVQEGGADNPTLVEQFAKGSLGGRAWLESFTNLGERHDLADIIKRIRQEAMLRIETVVKTSRELKESPKDFPRRAERNLGSFVRDHYGYRTSTGDERRGSFGDALDECVPAQVDIYRRLAQCWLLKSLMGGDKSGRLGYCSDLLDGLVNDLGEFLAFMDKVREKRQTLLPYMKAIEARDRAKRTMLEYAGSKIIAGLLDHPKAHETQTLYLRAEQAVVDARRDELLHESIVRAARQMQQHAAQMRDELVRWIQLLAVGDPATGVEGLFTVLDRQRRDIEQTQAADEKLTAVQTRLGELAYPQAQESEELMRLMASVQWTIAPANGGKFKLDLAIEPRDEARVQLVAPSGQERTEVRQSLAQRNLAALQSYAVQRFSNLPEETRVAQRLQQEFTPDLFADDIGGKAEPLFDKQPDQQGGAATWSELLRISSEGVDAATMEFLTRTIQARRARRGLPIDTRVQRQLVEVVGSADAHTCTIVRSDDLMPVDLFRAWHDCMAAYLRNERMPPHLNHNFPAESNAARLELKLAQKRRRQYRVFHPWVVMLLEHPDRLDQFFVSQALEWLQVVTDGVRSWYEFTIPDFDQPFTLTPSSTTLWSAFQAARFYVLDGLDKTEGSSWKLDYGEVQAALEKEEKQRGTDAWLAFLRGQVRSSGSMNTQAGANTASAFSRADEHLVVDSLRRRIQELDEIKRRGGTWPSGEPADYARAYVDLADVAQLLFEERLERKENQLTLGRQPRARIEPAA